MEIEAEVLLKGTRVDGVYTADPEKDPTATKFSTITFDEVYDRKLKVMDLTAFTMCKENDLPIVVFDMDTPGNLCKIVDGEPIGTVVKKCVKPQPVRIDKFTPNHLPTTAMKLSVQIISSLFSALLAFAATSAFGQTGTLTDSPALAASGENGLDLRHKLFQRPRLKPQYRKVKRW